ncbi:MAG: hypothetical protein JWQ27_218 [Ferruginibacter sp.]|nr:hypothetical protein [Ferruginibacter sp.]
MNKLYLISFFLFTGLTTRAQWKDNSAENNSISRSTTISEIEPIAVSDAAGGTIVVFMDLNDHSLHAQKITVDGTIAWGDSVSPVIISDAASATSHHTAIADGYGGVFISWSDHRNDLTFGDIYMQHINSDGVSLWTFNGINVSNSPAFDDYESFLTRDGKGGVIVGWNWDDYDNSIQVMAQRLDADGAIKWAQDGIYVTDAYGFRWASSIVSDGNFGAVILFTDTRNDPNGFDYYNYHQVNPTNLDVFAQKFDSSGNYVWGSDATPVCTAISNQTAAGANSTVTDANGALFIFNDARNDLPDAGGAPTNIDIYSQRFNNAGVRQWVANGLPVTLSPGNQSIKSTMADGLGGVVAAWEDENGKIYSQRMLVNGIASWTTNGVLISGAADYSYNPRLLRDTAKSTFMYLFEAQGAAKYLKAQKLSLAGALQFPASGAMVCNATDAYPSAPRPVRSDNGAIIVAWEDYRNTASAPDIYGSKLLEDGQLEATYISTTNGNWDYPGTWVGAIVPPADANVIIRNSVTITGNATCKSVKIERPSGQVTVKTGVKLTITN